MSTPPEYFARIAGSVNLRLLQSRLVVVVGIGTVGSQITQELARCGVGRFRLIDGDHLEQANRVRHVLPEKYIGINKAEAMTLHLADEVPHVRPEAFPSYVNEVLSDDQLDKLLDNADMIVAATDDREAQRRLARRALALSIPAIFPALYGNAGGEVIVQLDPRLPCFFCWDGFRTNEERLRGVTALNADTLPVIYTAIRLSLGILDPQSEHRRLIAGRRHGQPNQIFVQEPLAALNMAPLRRRPGCPSCAVGPAAGSGETVEPTTRPPNARAHTLTQPVPQEQPFSSPVPRPTPSGRPIAWNNLLASGFWVALWFFFFAEGWAGFRLWWNPAALIPLICWLVYFLFSVSESD